jgi:uncharacterized protein YydD (DUF2326 family)
MIIRLYSNHKEFEEISFHSGLNVILGEIRLKKDRDKDTHNLGKSTLCQILDFCLLKPRNNKSFPFKYDGLLHDYVFYLEMQLADGRYLTIRRGVASASKIWLHTTNECGIDARDLDDKDWTHSCLPFERAKILVDGLLDYGSLQPWSYRKVLGYLFRGQLDFGDVFRPTIFRGKDKDWKPFLLHIMGFDFEIFNRRYELEAEIEQLKEREHMLVGQLPEGNDDSGELDALLAIKQREVDDLQAFLDDFRLEPHDQKAVNELIEHIDAHMGELNDRRYDLRHSIAQIEKSLNKERLLFSTHEAKSLFEEAGILFEGQIEHSFDQLLAFNADITEERRSYLMDDLREAREELKQVEEELTQLDIRRAKLLDQLGTRDVVVKYKAATNGLVERRTELESIRQRRECVRDLQHVRRQIASKKSELATCDAEIHDEIDRVSDVQSTGLFAHLRSEFDDIVYKVISQHGMLSVSANAEGHAEFKAEISDIRGMSTSQDEGVTYKKLLCVAFDLALLLAHEAKGFPDFVYHDDAFGGLDNRKKENLRDIMRSCANRGVQQIVTAIDSELPTPDFFEAGEITLRLHDDGNDGRLFKMPEW